MRIACLNPCRAISIIFSRNVHPSPMHDIGVRQWGPYQRLHPPEAKSCPLETSQPQTAFLSINLVTRRNRWNSLNLSSHTQRPTEITPYTNATSHPANCAAAKLADSELRHSNCSSTAAIASSRKFQMLRRAIAVRDRGSQEQTMSNYLSSLSTTTKRRHVPLQSHQADTQTESTLPT